MIALSAQPILAKGNRQYVYQHPTDAGLLIKVPQPSTYDAEGHIPKAGAFERRFRRATMYKGFVREFREFLELKARLQDLDAQLPVCGVYGTVETDIGLGLVYERISNPDGSLPESLEDLIGNGRIREWHLPLLDTLFETLTRLHVVVGNENPNNVVFQSAQDGDGRFVWIDSFGCKQSIPIRKWFYTSNAKRLQRIRDNFLDQATSGLKTATPQT